MANMNITDDDLEELEETHPQAQLAAARAQQAGQTQAQVRLYDMSLAQTPAANGGEGLLKKKLGPLPVWGWGLIVAAVGTGGYVWYRVAKSSKVKANKDDNGSSEPSDDSDDDDHGDERPSGGWSPSRSMFGEKIEKHLASKGLASRCKVYVDADDAEKDKDLKTVSPLITIKVSGGKIKLDKGLERLCKREGLSPTVHEDGSIGLYPATAGKRGREWEAYVDALRDEGQTR